MIVLLQELKEQSYKLSTSDRLELDTHIWLWYLLADDRLSGELKSLIANPTNELWLSPINIWETVILAKKWLISLQPNTSITR